MKDLIMKYPGVFIGVTMLEASSLAFMAVSLQDGLIAWGGLHGMAGLFVTIMSVLAATDR